MIYERFKSFILPWQLRDEKFIKMNGYSKDPVKGESWLKYLCGAEFIEGWVRLGNNYGVAYTSNLAVIDVDDLEYVQKFCDLKPFENTYMVKSGRSSSIGLHLYVRIPDDTIPEIFKGNKVKNSKVVFIDNPETGKSVGDIRFPHTNLYNIGPYSIHPDSHNFYLPIDEDAPICFFSAQTILDIFDAVIPKKVPKARTEFKPACQISSELDYGFTCFDFLNPIEPRKRSDGSVEGAHPIHGSSTRTNLTISPDGKMWYCRHHHTGGGWRKALAVKYGIIDCSEANRDFTKTELRQIDDILEKLNPTVSEKRWIAWQQQKAARLNLGVVHG